MSEQLGAPTGGYGELGPVSPELALVDHALADRARLLLPEPRERAAPAPSAAEERRPEPVIRKRRWRRTVALALVIFAVGATSGGLLGRGRDESARTPLQAQARVATTPVPTDVERSATETRSGPAATREKQRAAVTKWASNVLGVSVGIGRKGVSLVWQRPVESNHVVVVRKLLSLRHSVVVFRGRATRFHDVSARPCTAYSYVIINYDRLGHPSTGVRTSVVTQGCGRRAWGRSSA